jgi:hypothetical protein
MRSTTRSLLLVCRTISYDIVKLFNMSDVVHCRGWEAALLVMVDASERWIGFDLHQSHSILRMGRCMDVDTRTLQIGQFSRTLWDGSWAMKSLAATLRCSCELLEEIEGRTANNLCMAQLDIIPR